MLAKMARERQQIGTNRRDRDVRFALNQLASIENTKKIAATTLEKRARELAETAGGKLPSLLFVNVRNWSDYNGEEIPTSHDRELHVILYAAGSGKLYELSGSFYGYDSKDPKVSYFKDGHMLEVPEFTYYDENQPSTMEMWLKHGVRTIIALREALIKLEKGETILAPTHSKTGKSLMPDKLPIPRSVEKKQESWELKPEDFWGRDKVKETS